ncbi:MAG: Major cell-binding factor precursor [Pseudomonadota bacterium]
MNSFIRRSHVSGVLLAVVFALSACAGLQLHSNQTPAVQATAEPSVQRALAPQGVLRVGVYLGSPTSLVRDAKSGASFGVAYELGHALAAQLNVPVQVVQYQRVAEVIDALKNNQVDMTFTNATAARAKEVDFTSALIQLELGLLVPVTSSIQTFESVDRAGVLLGVSQGSSSQGVLSQRLKNASLVPVPSLTQVQQLLTERKLDAFATNKGILFELAEKMVGMRVLDDSWGVENLAIAIPKGREAGMPYLQAFAQRAQQKGQVNQMAQRAGLRGLVRAN